MSTRQLMFAGLLVVLSAGCASGRQQRGQEAKSPAAESNVVNAEDIGRAPGEPIENVLRGRIAGVQVSRTPEGGIAVRIRGTTSFHGSTEPLYVVDGMAIQPGPNGALSWINPYDVESIKVLKDPAETSLYGSRGANGVVVIKTKKHVKPPQ